MFELWATPVVQANVVPLAVWHSSAWRQLMFTSDHNAISTVRHTICNSFMTWCCACGAQFLCSVPLCESVVGIKFRQMMLLKNLGHDWYDCDLLWTSFHPSDVFNTEFWASGRKPRIHPVLRKKNKRASFYQQTCDSEDCGNLCSLNNPGSPTEVSENMSLKHTSGLFLINPKWHRGETLNMNTALGRARGPRSEKKYS